MKTLTEWLLYLPPSVAQKALNSVKNERKDHPTSHLHTAISEFCFWSYILEGDDFWLAVYRGAEDEYKGRVKREQSEAYSIGYEAALAYRNENNQ